MNEWIVHIVTNTAFLTYVGLYVVTYFLYILKTLLGQNHSWKKYFLIVQISFMIDLN